MAALVALLVTAVWWVFFISPKNSEISDTEAQTQSTEDAELGLRAQLSQLQAIADSELTYRTALGELESAIPENPDMADFIEAINLLALESGVELSSISPAQPAPVDGAEFFAINLSMSLEGQYFEILGFLFGLSDMERLVRVDSISLNPLSVTEEPEVVADEPTDGSTTTSSTTTTTLPQQEGLLSASISSTLFTRTALLAPVAPVETTVPEGETTTTTEGG